MKNLYFLKSLVHSSLLAEEELISNTILIFILKKLLGNSNYYNPKQLAKFLFSSH